MALKMNFPQNKEQRLRPTWRIVMKTKKLTFLLSLTFLFLFSGSSVVFADDLKDGIDAGNKGDFKTAYKLLYPLAEQGNAEAQFFLGSMYDLGQGVPQDYKEAVRWYRLSAEQGHANAQFNLGVRYGNGQGVQRNYKEAAKWYRLSAEQGYAAAQTNLGVMYDSGQGVQRNYKEAVKWYRLSAEQGTAEAQFNLGLMYGHGQGVPQDDVLAYMWWNIAGSNGHKDAVTNRNFLEKRMTPSQIEKAQRLERNRKPKKSIQKVSNQEKDAKKMTDYYKGASDQEIDKFIIGLTNAKKKVLPQKLNKGITLYKVEYIKDGNVVGYAYEVNADNLGLTEKELVAGKQNLTDNLREHHKRYFCTVPVIRMELDIGIDFLINIISANDNYVGSYQISKDDCIN
jgi:TPR repeat protein